MYSLVIETMTLVKLQVMYNITYLAPQSVVVGYGDLTSWQLRSRLKYPRGQAHRRPGWCGPAMISLNEMAEHICCRRVYSHTSLCFFNKKPTIQKNVSVLHNHFSFCNDCVSVPFPLEFVSKFTVEFGPLPASVLPAIETV